MRKYLRIGSFVTLALAVLCWILEAVYYDYVDEQGILHESFFLPLAFMLFVVGIFEFGISFLFTPNFRRNKSQNSTPTGN